LPGEIWCRLRGLTKVDLVPICERREKEFVFEQLFDRNGPVALI
jgi:hypothetical protein